MNKENVIMISCIIVYIVTSIILLQSIIIYNFIDSMYVLIGLILVLCFCVYEIIKTNKKIYDAEIKGRQKLYTEANELIAIINKYNGDR